MSSQTATMARNFHSSQSLRNRLSVYGGSPFPKRLVNPRKSEEQGPQWVTGTVLDAGDAVRSPSMILSLTSSLSNTCCSVNSGTYMEEQDVLHPSMHSAIPYQINFWIQKRSKWEPRMWGGKWWEPAKTQHGGTDLRPSTNASSSSSRLFLPA